MSDRPSSITVMENSNKNRKIHKIVVDRDACISAATCVVVSPKSFELDEEGIAVVKSKALEVSDDELFVAAQSCPTQAILLYDENGEQIFPK